jgi:hypothetical protein
MDREQREVFEQYFRWQAGRAGAVTPGQMLDLVRELRKRAQEQGEFPLGPQTRGKLPPNDPMVKAVLAGEDVSVGGRRVVQKSTRPGGLRAVIALAAFLIPVVIAMFLLMARGRGRAQAAPTPTPLSLPPGLAASPTAPAPVGAAATATSLPLFAAGMPTATAIPTTTASGYAVVLGLEEAAAGANDPASLEIAGNTFALGMGKPQAGVWQPTGGAEWLAGTELRRVIAIPVTDALAAAVARLRAGDEIRLRLRSGEVVRYQVGDVVRVKRHQIEVLAGRNPSLVVVLYGERAGDRTVVIAEAVQEEAFAVYTPVPGPLPTPATTTATQIITTATVVTNEVAGLVLEVSPCNRVARVGDQQPPKTSQQFMVCPVRLRALRDGAQYSGQSLAVTEKDWFLGAVGWWPPTVALPTAIGEGALMTGEEVSGKVAGIVSKSALARRSEPVLVWEQSGIQYIIILE